MRLGLGRTASPTLILGEWRKSFRMRLIVCQWLVSLLPVYALSTVRASLYRRLAGFTIGPLVGIHGKIRVMGCGEGFRGRLKVGRGSVLGCNLTVYLDDEVSIGEQVSFSPEVRIITASHLIGPPSRRMNPTYFSRPVVVEDGAWICYGATLMPGVTIGRGAVVGAHSVVQQDVAANTFVVGSPARVVCELPDGSATRRSVSVSAAEVPSIARNCASDVLGIPPEELTDETSPTIDRRWSSLKHVKLMDEIAAATGIRLTESEYLYAQTFGDVVRMHQRAASLLLDSSR